MAVLDGPVLPPGPGPVRGDLETWAVQAAKFLAVIDAAAGRPPGETGYGLSGGSGAGAARG